MSPIKCDDDTRLTEEDEDIENEAMNNATFVKDSFNSATIVLDDSQPSPSNSTFVIGAAPTSEADGVPPIKRKSRRTDLGPL